MFVAPLEKFKQGIISEGSGIGWVGGHWRPDQCLSFVSESDDEGWTFCYVKRFCPSNLRKLDLQILDKNLVQQMISQVLPKQKLHSHWQLARVAMGQRFVPFF